MPLYEYECGRCGGFELIRKFSDEPLTVCPTCGSEVQKLLSAPAIQFKGTGWYATDYAGKSKSSEKGDSGKGDSGKGDSGKGDSGKGDSGPSGSGTGGSSPSADSTSKPASEGSSTTTQSKKSKSD
jgi:putative FmdB family regulatory protein